MENIFKLLRPKQVERALTDGPEVKKFLELEPEEEEELRKKIEESNGITRIFVHPYYDINHNRIHKGVEEQRMIRTIQKMEQMIHSGDRKAPPIIILEEEEFYSNLKNKLNLPDKKSNSVLMVETIPNDPTPLQGFEKFIDQLRNLGVIKIITGGQRLYISPLMLTQEGCLGLTNNALKGAGFEVVESYLSSPDNRTTVNDPWKEEVKR